MYINYCKFKPQEYTLLKRFSTFALSIFYFVCSEQNGKIISILATLNIDFALQNIFRMKINELMCNLTTDSLERKLQSTCRTQEKQNCQPTLTFGNNQIKDMLEDGNESKAAYESLVNNHYSTSFLAFVNLVSMVLYYDADYNQRPTIAKIYLHILEATLIFQIILTILVFKNRVKLEKSQKILNQHDGIVSSNNLVNLLTELVTILPRPYSWLNQLSMKSMDIHENFEFDYRINHFLVILGTWQVFVIIKAYMRNTIYLNPRASRVCRMHGTSEGYKFAIKCMFKDRPFLIAGSFLVLGVFFYTLYFRITEGSLNKIMVNVDSNQKHSHRMMSFENAFWLAFVTMTQVGYGDFFPQTMHGRLMAAMAIYWGAIFMSIIINSLLSTLKMQESEQRALIVLNRLNKKKELKQSAAFIITHKCKEYLERKKSKDKPSQEEQRKMDIKFRNYTQNFQKTSRKIYSMYDLDDKIEEMSRQFGVITEILNEIVVEQRKSLKNLKEINQRLEKVRENRVK